VEINRVNNYIIDKKSFFHDSYYNPYQTNPKANMNWHPTEMFDVRRVFEITGDWGYNWVPNEVREAFIILFEQSFSGDSIADAKAQGVWEIHLGDFFAKISQDVWGSTGNAQADNLLAPFTLFGMWLI